MLPAIRLKDVIREDVDRIGMWLSDDEVSSRWFGHYACGDPIHRGYEPQRMLEADAWEWERVFVQDPNRHIFSIFDGLDRHIGESQILFDHAQGAELSLLIGRKELWHHGYGTSTVVELMDRAFNYYGLQRIWVNVPEDNAAALGLFQKLGFTNQERHELCRRPDDTALNTWIMSIEASPAEPAMVEDKPEHRTAPVITIAGLPGSGSEAIGREAARLLGARFVDAEITDRVSQRLGCTTGDVVELEERYQSKWSRLLHSQAVPTYWGAGYEFDYLHYRSHVHDREMFRASLTERQYLEALERVTRELALEGNVVIHRLGSHRLLESRVAAVNVFVAASTALRQRRVEAELGLSAEEAGRWVKRSDKSTRYLCRHLLGFDLDDMSAYDFTLNPERGTDRAIQTLVGAAKDLRGVATEREATPVESV